jgi:hypothetical protein
MQEHPGGSVAEYVEANLNYFSPPAAPESATARPAFYVYRPTEAERTLSPEIARHRVRVRNARLMSAPSLDTQGVALVPSESAVSDFYDADEVREVYYPEVEGLVRTATGAARVVAFDHNVRCETMAKRGEGGAQMPVKSAHNDYTEESAPQRVRDLFPDEAEDLLTRRFAVINVWKPIRGPVKASPLAVCDAQSIEPVDWMPTDLRYRDRRGEVYALSFNPEHVWYYFPDMLDTEAMLLKCYDSETDGRARFTAHTAFTDPRTPEDAPARESVEVRTLAFF